MIRIGLTDHIEGPRDRPSAEIFAEVGELVEIADRLGVAHAWFTEHHAHAHHGHLPTPLLFASHLLGRTRRIELGTAVICLNLHHPLDVAEQTVVADLLSGGRLAPGFGSGSTPEEFTLFGVDVTAEAERHARFEEALHLILSAWRGSIEEPSTAFRLPAHRPLPIAATDLPARTWLAVNSEGSAAIAGRLGFNMLFSHLRTPEQYRRYREVYLEAGGNGAIAANRPVFVGVDDESAFREAEPALRTLWRRFRAEGKIAADTREPEDPRNLTGHPINFIVGGPDSVARAFLDLHEQIPYDVMNVEVRWANLDHEQVLASLERLMRNVVPMLPTGRCGRGATSTDSASRGLARCESPVA
ncbi:MAG: LLM class flavin-dependent oxidoreductase [Isosphaeraceae bacterium]|nr:LLM class flavin-dependent oxidoreductase [Isosphaeraceae bacterium]